MQATVQVQDFSVAQKLPCYIAQSEQEIWENAH